MMYKLNEEKMFHDVADGVAIVINFTTGIYFSFNLLGTAILGGLLAGADEAVILAGLKKMPDCPGDMELTLHDFVKKMLEKQILLGSEGEATSYTMEKSACAEGFTPSFEEFAEVQDLIMADPVHEVDPRKGWPALKKE